MQLTRGAQGGKQVMTKRQSYRYAECGLDNVVIEGMEVVIDDAGEEVICIPNIVTLHRAIAEAIIIQPFGISGQELRFLRTEMGLSQAELAEVLKISRLTVSRWERGENEIDGNAEFVVRLLATERLDIGLDLSYEEMAKRCVLTHDREPIRIDGSDPKNYQALAA